MRLASELCRIAHDFLTPLEYYLGMMRVGIASDHGGFGLKQQLEASLHDAGYEVVDFGAYQLNSDDDYPNFIIPLAEAVASGAVERGIAPCGSGIGASIAANKVPGVRAGLIHDVFSAHQGVEDDEMNVFCLGGKVIGSALAWELVEAFLGAHFSGASRHRRRVSEVEAIEDRTRGAKTTHPGEPMKATQKLHDMGQSLWLDNITRGLLISGTLERYIKDLSVTGLTSNPTIFDHAIKNSHDYDDAIQQKLKKGMSGEDLFFDLAIEDLRQAADLFLPAHEATNGVDGWVSLEVSPKLAYDTAGTLAAAKALHIRAARANLFIKIPGTKEGLPAIEEAIFQGYPINVTLLFSASQYVAAAEAYLRGIERRIVAGLNPDVGSVASLFVSRWDVAVASKIPEALHNKLGIAIAGQTLDSYRSILNQPRWQRAFNAGASAQRLLFASTGTKDPKASDTLYVGALAEAFTVNTMPEKTLTAFADHGEIDAEPSRFLGTLNEFKKAGINTDDLADQLLTDGAKSFVKSWTDLLACIAAKSGSLKAA
jgi:transaldolase